MHNFEPTLQAAQARLAAVQPSAYAQTRNALDGAVSRLSPYLTHGLLSLRDVFDAVNARHTLDMRHKFVFELGWRAYYRHVWEHLGEGIHQSLHPGPLPEAAYRAEIPTDVTEARTGIAAIDLAVRELYACGYLHNHARMWLASYLVHLRKVHWHTAATWMLGHLLDGDVGSNHLSWQWVAGTGSSKPYLFNADNVGKFAPAAWHSPGTVLDTSYETLDRLARSAASVGHSTPGRLAGAGMVQPPLMGAPPDPRWSVPDPHSVAGRDVFLLHPWSLGAASQQVNADAVWIGVGFAELHAHLPWSARRWNFVTEGLLQQTSRLWWGNLASLAQALRGAHSVGWQVEAHAKTCLQGLQMHLEAERPYPSVHTFTEPSLFAPVAPYCESFSKWWRLTEMRC